MPAAHIFLRHLRPLYCNCIATSAIIFFNLFIEWCINWRIYKDIELQHCLTQTSIQLFSPQMKDFTFAHMPCLEYKNTNWDFEAMQEETNKTQATSLQLHNWNCPGKAWQWWKNQNIIALSQCVIIEVQIMCICLTLSYNAVNVSQWQLQLRLQKHADPLCNTEMSEELMLPHFSHVLKAW